MGEEFFQVHCRIDQGDHCLADRRVQIAAGQSVAVASPDFLADITVHGVSAHGIGVTADLQSKLSYITPDLSLTDGEPAVIEFCGRVVRLTVKHEG